MRIEEPSVEIALRKFRGNHGCTEEEEGCLGSLDFVRQYKSSAP